MDQGEEMKTSNNGVLYEMDNTVAFEDFWLPDKVSVRLMVADFHQKKSG